VHLERLDEAPDPQALNAAMERLIRRFPAQYLWGYNRYKSPSGAAAASRPDTPEAPR
jgi:KDO2-lipid IV(A) lauroyltransferase